MFRRLGNLLRGFISLLIGGAERRNPEALLEVEKENLRRQISQYNEGLAAHAGLCERLMAQVRKLENDDRDLRAKTTANLRAGNRDAAAQYALRLQTVQREIGENRTQLEQAEKTYRELLKAREVTVRAAQAKLESLKQSIDDLKIKRATAELAEMAASMVNQAGGGGDTLNRLETMIEEERTKAAGRARLARDTMNSSGVVLKEEEQKALAEQALADFARNEGMQLEPSKPVKLLE